MFLRTWRTTILLAAITGIASCALFSAGSARRPGFARCAIPDVEDAQCRSVAVFENRATRTGRTIPLRVVLLPARTRRPEPDAVFFIAGGPGQAASSLAGFAGELFKDVRRKRDIVLVDVRGTGSSHPLNCDLYPDLASYFGDLFPRDAVRKCRAQLETDADLRQYTTRHLADDLDEVRGVLGYERVNLYGTSYGSAAARVYLARHPERVRSLVIKAIAPMTAMPLLSYARDAQHALDVLLGDCEADNACGTAFPNIRAEARSVFARLDSANAPARARDPRTGASHRVMISRGAFAGSLLTAMQGPTTAAAIPALIHEAYHGNYGPAARLIVGVRRTISSDLSWGMHFSVLCTEGNPPVDDPTIARESAGSFLGDYRVRQQIQACEEWPRGDSTGFGAIRVSNVPALLSSGSLDPNTPPRWGAEAARFLPNSRHLVVRYGSHNFGNLRGCVDVLMNKFVGAASATTLDTSCVAKIRFPPFVTTREAAEVPLSSDMLASFAGEYRKRIPPLTVAITPLGEVLQASFRNRKFTLVHIGDNRFRVEDVPGYRVDFKLENGRPTKLLFNLQGKRVSLSRR
jgi:pimeloyl-ACP methyl ester carboxylesterase